MNKKGFTLIELVISIMIAAIVVAAVYQVFNFGTKARMDIQDEYAEQSEVRYAMTSVNNTVRLASVGFIVSGDDYQPVENSSGKVTSGLVKGWSYIGLNPDKTQIVRYEYKFVDNDGDGVNDNTNFDYEKEVLFEAQPGITLDFEFNKMTDPQDDSLLEYNVEGNNASTTVFDFKTELEALNAIQVINWSGTNSNKGVAFAYRKEETPNISERTVGALAMVMDRSGSMNEFIDGKRRINLLKQTLNDPTDGLFAVLKNTGSYANIVPFSSNADSPKGFKNIDKQLGPLKSNVNSLSPNGGTNTGDGIKRAYYELVNFNNNPPSDVQGGISNYLVVLVDGRTTMGTLKGNKSGWRYYYNKNYPTFHLGSQNTGNKFRWRQHYWNGWDNSKHVIYGYGNLLDDKYGEEYIRQVGNKISSSSLNVKQSFVIGYSDNMNDLKSLKNIATSLDISVTNSDPYNQYKDNEYVFVATDRDSLVEAFNDIGSYVKEDLWQVNGPKLNP